MDIAINYLAVIVAAIVVMVIGAIWYGPLFGKRWMRLMGFSKEDMKSMKMTPMQAMVGASLASLVMVFVLAHFVKLFNAGTVSGALQLGFWTWLGFVATVQLNIVLFENRSWKLYFLNVGHHLVTFIAAAIILTLWP